MTWWLKHELRLELRQMTLDFGPVGAFVSVNLLLGLYGILHVFAWLLQTIWLANTPKEGLSLDAILLVAVITACSIQGGRAAYRGLFIRRDGEQFRVAAASMTRILRARSLAITTSSLLVPFFWISPLANIRLLCGLPGGGELYALLLSLGALSTSMAIALMLIAVSIAGREGARNVGQVLLVVVLMGLALAQPISEIIDWSKPAAALKAVLGQQTNRTESAHIISFLAALSILMLLAMPILLRKGFELSLGKPKTIQTGGRVFFRIAPRGLLLRLVIKKCVWFRATERCYRKYLRVLC